MFYLFEVDGISRSFVTQNIKGTVSFTFNTWTSKTGDPSLSVTGHYMTEPGDKPNEWKLNTQQLEFIRFEMHHSGVNMSNILVHTVDRYDIRKNVCKVTLLSDLSNLYHVGWVVYCRQC